MLMLRPRHCLTLILLSTLAGACGDSAVARDVRQELRDALQAAENLAIETWDGVVREATPRLQLARAELRRLRDEIATRGGQVAQRAEQALQGVAVRLDEIRARLESAGEAGAEPAAKAWGSIRDGLRQTADAFDAAWQALREDEVREDGGTTESERDS